jgi:hypothetical protein
MSLANREKGGRKMIRNIPIFILVLGVAYVTPTCLDRLGSVARGDVSPESTTLSLGQLILRDNFEDNQKGPLWRLYTEDVNNCTVVETNGRLEFRSAAAAGDAFAGYIANAWRLDPQEDFALRVDAHYDLTTLAGGWVNIGITPNAEKPRSLGLEIGIGCAALLPCFWYSQIDRWVIESSRWDRIPHDASLYFSYTAADDTLYISDSGYGQENAWITFPGLLKGQWEGQPVFVYLGGRSDGLEITAGHAYLDNLLVERGLVIEAALQEVYRFWSPVYESHFYTMDELEKEKLLVNYPRVWTYEGVVYYAYPDNSDPACRPVHRFWSPRLSKHFYTISDQEKNTLLDQYASTWTYEGVAFYAYPEGQQPAWTLPVYRFWSDSKSAHFYTMEEAEKNAVLNEYGDIWTYEGIAWYANP